MTSKHLPRWESVMSNIHRQNRMARVAKPGHFNDPDMLQVGNVGLTLTEQYSHMSLWCVASAPLLAGTDIIHASRATLNILANPEVTAVNQDLGREGAIQVMCCLAWIRSHFGRALNLILEEYASEFSQSITLHFPLATPDGSRASLSARVRPRRSGANCSPMVTSLSFC